jgi:nitroreductase
MDGQEFEGLAAASRSFRRYDGSLMGEGDLRALVAAARLAPSGNNLQVVRFRLVTGTLGCATTFSHLHWAGLLRDWDGPAAGERPGGYVIVCLPERLAANPVRLIDVGIAAQTMALAARARGLGCCMLRNFDAALAADLALPDDLTPVLVLAVGVPVEHVVLEDVGASGEHGLAYWRETDGSHHVPKLSVGELLV